MALILVLAVLSCTHSANTPESERPQGVPSGAQWDPQGKRFYVSQQEGNVLRTTLWDEHGLIAGVSTSRIGSSEKDSTLYVQGRWSRRTISRIEGSKLVEIRMPPAQKEQGIPPGAEFNFMLNKWEDGPLVRGRKEGIWHLWWPGGAPAGVAAYHSDQLHGDAALRWENGKLMSSGAFVSGHRTGEHRSYFADGKLHEVQNFRAGKLHGTVCTFDALGNLLEGNVWVSGDFKAGEKALPNSPKDSVLLRECRALGDAARR